jgi:glycosyltransferase involved in cell wall biosynthesis
MFYSQVAGFAAVGTNARNHLQRLGVPPQKIRSSPFCVDSEFVEQQVQHWRPQRDSIRRALNISPHDFVLMFSGKLIEKKQPLLIPRAVQLLPANFRERLHWIVVGDGEQRTAVETEGRLVFGGRLHMAGFVNQSEIGRWYAAADCLVLPSRRGAGETWGLVVNEAMQFGLPALVSDGVGASRDLVSDGDTGLKFRSGDSSDLARCILEWCAGAPDPRVSFERCRAHIAGYGLEPAVAGLADVLRLAAGSSLRT